MVTTRDRYDIFLDILKAAGRNSNGSSLTSVIRAASLNAQLAKESMIYLLETGLIEFNSKEKTLTTTAKGWQFIRLYESLNRCILRQRELSPIQSRHLWL